MNHPVHEYEFSPIIIPCFPPPTLLFLLSSFPHFPLFYASPLFVHFSFFSSTATSPTPSTLLPLITSRYSPPFPLLLSHFVSFLPISSFPVSPLSFSLILSRVLSHHSSSFPVYPLVSLLPLIPFQSFSLFSTVFSFYILSSFIIIPIIRFLPLFSFQFLPFPFFSSHPVSISFPSIPVSPLSFFTLSTPSHFPLPSHPNVILPLFLCPSQLSFVSCLSPTLRRFYSSSPPAQPVYL